MKTPPEMDCETPNTHREHRVTEAQGPVCCPPPRECLWNSHPRVYLALDSSGRARCPYCSTLFVRASG
jgi:uncharacterized Zn-finger protein